MWKYVIYEMTKSRMRGTRERRLRTLYHRIDAEAFVKNYVKVKPDAIVRIEQVAV
ncbi:hypothetical protein ACIFQM_11060 [Paenibacillus sp. NRS-1782]|uniref:hypothetical protein n=1 Tax=unclassified Paenibacillus TaxID=185978 RepID=UPI003D29AD39